MRFGFVGSAYTDRSSLIAAEECINFFPSHIESQSPTAGKKVYGGQSADSKPALIYTPGLSLFATFTNTPVREFCLAGNRLFVVAGASFVELSSTAVQTRWGAVATDNNRASMAYNGNQVLIVSGGHAYCFTLATGALTEVTSQLAAIPIKVEFSDGYFIVIFQNSNKFQLSALLDGTSWPGTLVNAPNDFPENLVSIAVNHRELWVFGGQHAQPYQNTGSLNVFDVIPGTLIEMGSVSTFCTTKLDNSIFWIHDDERGGRMAWRSNGYTPARISTYGVEVDLASYPSLDGISAYAYQEAGHLFWVIYIPGANWSWAYDVNEGLWHKRSSWNAAQATWGPHWSWIHVRAFNSHLVGDWNTGNVYTMSHNAFSDNGTNIRRVRRAPTLIDEMQWQFHSSLTIDFEMGNLSSTLPSDLPNFAPNLLGPNGASSAVNTPITGAIWVNPGNALLNKAVYATNTGASFVYQATAVQTFFINSGSPLHPINLYYALITLNAPAPEIGSNFTFAGFTFSSLNGLTLQSASGNPDLGPVPSSNQILVSFGTTVVPIQGSTPDSGTATLVGVTKATDALDITGFSFTIPYTSTPKGIMANVLTYASVAGVSITIQLLKNGSPIGNTLGPLAVPTNPAILQFGTLNSLFGISPTYSDINDSTFGVRITASAAVNFTLNVGYTTMSVYCLDTNNSLNYVGPDPGLTDGSGNRRPPQAVVRWSDDRGKTWSNDHIVNMGDTGQTKARAIIRRLGKTRYRVYELSISDTVPVNIVDAYLNEPE